jgi:hypothetical protein
LNEASFTAFTATSGVIITASRETRTMKSLVRRCKRESFLGGLI